MKIQSNTTYPSYGMNPSLMSKPKTAQALSFKGKEGAIAEQAFKLAKNELKNPLTKAAFTFFHQIGKVQSKTWFTTVVNGIGTAVVAPIMVVWGSNAVMTQLEKVGVPNPFKGNKKTDREYSALRQPVSAVLAIALQAPIQSFTQKGLKAAIDKGRLGKIENAGGFAKTCSIVLSLATLMPQVAALNLLYPKFIKLVRPDLAKAKEKPKSPPPPVEIKKDAKSEGGQK